MGLTIGAVAQQGGVNLQTVRYYEREGLLPAPPRRASGYRVFPEEAVQQLHFIKRAQELGFTLAEIRELLSLRLDHEQNSSVVRALALSKIAAIEDKIRSLEEMKATLVRLADKCSGQGPVSECPILESIDSDEAFGSAPRTAGAV